MSLLLPFATEEHDLHKASVHPKACQTEAAVLGKRLRWFILCLWIHETLKFNYIFSCINTLSFIHPIKYIPDVTEYTRLVREYEMFPVTRNFDDKSPHKSGPVVTCS